VKKKNNNKSFKKSILIYNQNTFLFVKYDAMEVKIFWKWEETQKLLWKVTNILEELGLTDFIKVETTNDSKLKEELKIEKEPALIVLEESIDFKDTIFEWIVPEDEELRSMFISIIGGGWSGWWCAPEWCGSWCSC
jgi:hypothetical protein